MKKKLLKTRGWLNRIAAFLAIEALVLFAAGSLPIKPSAEVRLVTAEDPLPGVKLSPEELAQVDVNDALRDRLRADPRSHSLLRAMRKDLAATQWTKSVPETPAWVSYGAKAFPLLDYYTQSPDRDRQQYGLAGIRKLGKPYTTLWLRKQLQRRSQSKVWEADWNAEFGLDDPQIRAEMVSLALANLESQESPTYRQHFNLRFLIGLKVNPDQKPEFKGPYFEREMDLTQWQEWENLQQLSAQQIQQVYPYYRNLSAHEQEEVYRRVEKAKAGELSALKRVLLQNLMNDRQAPERLWAIVELDRHGDATAFEVLQDILDNDHRLISQRLISEGSWYWQPSYFLGMATRHPDSRFTQGCREYGDLVGHSYFGDEKRSPEILQQLAQKTPEQNLSDWQDWLDRYPDHPGADDATEHLAQSYLDTGDPVAATRTWFRLMTQPLGDGDGSRRGIRHVREMLDVGLSIDQIQTLLDDPELTEVVPLLRYALAVHSARNHDYAKALQVSAGLDMNQISDRVLSSAPHEYLYRYPYSIYPRQRWNWEQQKMQQMLIEQRQRWQQLNSWQQENTSESRYKIASNWAATGGWKNGYLPIWKDRRVVYLPTSDRDSSGKNYYYPSACRTAWVCDRSRRGDAAVTAAYQKGNSNAVAIALYQDVLNDPKTSNTVRERSLYMIANTLVEQWNSTYGFVGEMQQMHPPSGVVAGPKKRIATYEKGTRFEFEILRDYQHRIDSIIAELEAKFPQSSYTDDLLMFNYFLSWQPRYLQQIVEKYPNGDRLEEAQVLLSTPLPTK